MLELKRQLNILRRALIERRVMFDRQPDGQLMTGVIQKLYAAKGRVRFEVLGDDEALHVLDPSRKDLILMDEWADWVNPGDTPVKKAKAAAKRIKLLKTINCYDDSQANKTRKAPADRLLRDCDFILRALGR